MFPTQLKERDEARRRAGDADASVIALLHDNKTLKEQVCVRGVPCDAACLLRVC